MAEKENRIWLTKSAQNKWALDQLTLKTYHQLSCSIMKFLSTSIENWRFTSHDKVLKTDRWHTYRKINTTMKSMRPIDPIHWHRESICFVMTIIYTITYHAHKYLIAHPPWGSRVKKVTLTDHTPAVNEIRDILCIRAPPEWEIFCSTRVIRYAWSIF